MTQSLEARNGQTGNTQFLAEQIAQFFGPRFVHGDISQEMARVGKKLVRALPKMDSNNSYTVLLDLGERLTPVVEAAHPRVVEKDPYDIPTRIGHTLVWAQNEMRLRNGDTPMPRFQRDGMIFDFSDRLNQKNEELNSQQINIYFEIGGVCDANRAAS